MTARPIENARPRDRNGFRLLIWSIVGVIGWLGAVAIGTALWNAEPRAAGFDWDLVLEAGRRVASGLSPYDPALIAGTADLGALDLFYSYPPPIGQAAALIAGVPALVSLLVLDAIAVIGTVIVSWMLVRTRSDIRPVDAVLPIIAILPLLFPVTLALVFGNIDVLFPLVYGAVLLSTIAVGSGRRRAVVGGIAIAAATVAKIQPGGIGLWLLVRGLRERRDGGAPRSWTVLLAAIGAGIGIAVISLIIGGLGPWRDYVGVIGVIAQADVVVRANIGPAAQIALVAGLDASVARTLYLIIAAAALVLIAAAAWRVRDAVLSLAIGSAATLILLPITWYHYPPALLPFAVLAVIRSHGSSDARPVLTLVALAGIVASLALALPVVVWVAVILVIVAVAMSDPDRQRAASPIPGTAASPSG